MNLKDLAPIAIFAHTRIGHLQQLLNTLKKNKYIGSSDIFFFIDGPGMNTNDEYYIDQVHNVAYNFKQYCQSLTIVRRSENLGISESVTKGVSSVLKNSDRIIVLEDDLLVAENFLEYMNVMLKNYANNNRVMGVSGYRMALGENFEETFFLPTMSSWGWGTWRRAWNKLDKNPARLLDDLIKTNTIKRFNFGICSKMNMLKNHAWNNVDSWAVLFNATIAINKGLVIWPGKSFVQNNGFDDFGSHTKTRKDVYYHNKWTTKSKNISYKSKKPKYNNFRKIKLELEISNYNRESKFSKIKSILSDILF